MSDIVVRVVDAEGDPLKGERVTLWWKGFGLPESGTDEYTDADGEATFRYSTETWPGDEVAVYVDGDEYEGYGSPDSYYEITK